MSITLLSPILMLTLEIRDQTVHIHLTSLLRHSTQGSIDAFYSALYRSRVVVSQLIYPKLYYRQFGINYSGKYACYHSRLQKSHIYRKWFEIKQRYNI